MFNLIVSGNLENGRRGLMSVGRVFEHTDEEIEARFAPRGDLDVPGVQRLPTIFMNEGIGDEVVTIGWIERIERRGRGYNEEYRFEYRRDLDVPPMTNADIYEMADELGITGFEFSRNHWAIKNADLFHILFRHQASRIPRPSVFALSDSPVVPNRVSMMMPFEARFDGVYSAVRASVDAAGFECHRADNFWFHPHIMQDIVELLCTSRVIICDFSGKNPNVFYETGIAHMLGKDAILITQSMDDVPFDLRSLRCITYHNNGEGVAKLAEEVTKRLRTIIGTGDIAG